MNFLAAEPLRTFLEAASTEATARRAVAAF